MIANIQFDMKEIERKLEALPHDMPKINKAVVRAVLKAMTKDIKSLIKSNFTRRTGRLLRSVKYDVLKDGSGIITTKHAEKAKSGWYALMLEKGAHIRPRKKTYLVFRMNGEWKKVKRAVLPARPFMLPVAQDYLNNDSSKARDVMEQELQKQVDVLFEKNKA